MKKYSSEISVQYLVALLKAHNIKKVIASPGTTNLSFVASIQYDSFFEIYSCVDERSAAYMACGLAAETNEPVVITCTGATASRNYLPALTEAYYRKLPILAVTGTQNEGRIGNLSSQLIDRSVIQNDVAVLSVHIPALVESSSFDDKRCVKTKLNRAITALTRRGGGPVHINLQTLYSRNFSVNELPDVQAIKRIGYSNLDKMPNMMDGRIGIFVGSHNTMSKELTNAIDHFCASRNAVVFCDHTSGYYGTYKVNFSLVTVQEYYETELCDIDLCIHIGEISAEYGCIGKLRNKEVWRVSEDGEIRDLFDKLTYLFELTEIDFFNYYTIEGIDNRNSYLLQCKEEYQRLFDKIPDIPFSNIWAASILSKEIPEGSVLHLGVLNSIRSWNMFELPKNVRSFANVGGFGIDGGVSSLVGASLAHNDKLYIGVVGDLAFFYDMNSLGNRHIRNNIRLLIVNNGRGQEFRNFYHVGSTFGDDADIYMAAAGHYGNKSNTLVKHYAEDLGFEYLCASSKQEFLSVYKKFLSIERNNKSIIFEIFTNNEDENEALKSMWNIETTGSSIIRSKIKKAAVSVYQTKTGDLLLSILGKKGLAIVRRILHSKS